MSNFNIKYCVVIKGDVDIEGEDVRDALATLSYQHTEEALTNAGIVEKFLITEVKNSTLDEY